MMMPTGSGVSEGDRVVGGDRQAKMVAVRVAWMMFTLIFALLGGVFGYSLSVEYIQWRPVSDLLQGAEHLRRLSMAGIALMGAMMGFLIASLAYRKIVTVAGDLRRISFADKVAGIVGIVLGLAVSIMISYLVRPLRPELPYFSVTVPFLAAIICVYLGTTLSMSMKDELVSVMVARAPAEPNPVPEEPAGPRAKVLDTNVIIDGRMADVCKTGFLEGPLYVPAFVLEELQRIADSEDALRRARGRRGLEMLSRMQRELPTRLEVYDEYGAQFDRLEQVDTKLVRLAGELGAAVITNDYNLNKVAEVRQVPVLNLNELASALKPVVLPGEELRVTVVKEGKENRQGVAYLEDGTMVVVEEAMDHIGQSVDTIVTSVLQTVAGKMIFSQLKGVPSPSESARRGVDSGGDLFADDRSDSPGGRPRRSGSRGRGR